MKSIKAWWEARVTRKSDIAWQLYRDTALKATSAEQLRLLGLPETSEARFEALALELAALWLRLEQGCEDVQALRRRVAEAFVADMDASLRDLGAGDLGVGRRVQALTERLYGRIAAYRVIFSSDISNDAIKEILERNLYKEGLPEGAEIIDSATHEVRRIGLAWEAVDDQGLLSGKARA